MILLKWIFYELSLCIVLSSPLTANERLLIITHSFNRPDFIEIQDKTFKRFIKSPYEFVVFNDAKTPEFDHAIQSTCDSLNIRCVRIPQSVHKSPGDPAICCADVVQYSLDTLGFDHNGYVMIIDADMFVVQPFDVNEFMQDTLIAGHPQSRGHVNYIWNGIVILDMKRLPDKQSLDFRCGIVDGHLCDVGGYTYYYFQNHPEITLKPMTPHYWLENYRRHNPTSFSPIMQLLFRRRNFNCELFLGSTFFHYRSGGNWDRKSPGYHRKKSLVLHELIDFVMK